MTHRIYVGGRVHVRRRQCDTCIFGPRSPVSVERRQELVTTCGDQGVIPCHHHLYGDEPVEPVCAGFAHLNVTVPLRLAHALGVVAYVEDR